LLPIGQNLNQKGLLERLANGTDLGVSIQLREGDVLASGGCVGQEKIAATTQDSGHEQQQSSPHG
jgi:hypothetical protein